MARLVWCVLLFWISFGGSLHAATFAICTSQAEPDCVVNGDTIRSQGVTIRMEDIDAPSYTRSKCEKERDLGQRSAARLVQLLNVGPFDIILNGKRDVDPIGRQLRSLFRNGKSLGMQLVAEGLAIQWKGKRGQWCP